jgi:ubiquinone/menaquinone biosynthesis C-methylase UbiE
VYGIDVGAPMVRYAHARAESWGVPVHFSQQNGTTTNFPDGFFDIVTSCLVNHEAPVHVINDLFKEGNRILAKGGLYLTDGGYKRDVQPPEKQLLGDWFTNNVNEPFASGLSRIDYAKSFEKAGFNPDGFFISGSRPAAYMSSMFDDKKKKVGGVSYVGSFKL